MNGTGGVPANAVLGIDGFTDAVEIGRGGFGVVYRAHQPAHGRDVAIKILTSSRDAAATGRFERERQVLGALSGHPAIVSVIDSGYTVSGQAYVVMELMAGGSLGERVSTTGPLLWPQAVEIGIGIAGGLEVAHRMGVLHRDVKPDNLLVSPHNDVKLADFGVATFVGGASSRTWSVIASVAYAAPEVLAGQRSTVVSDVYGLGATVFALLYGRAPFARSSDDSIVPMVTRILNDRVPDLRPHGVPDEVCAVLERAMSRDPAERYPSAASFGAALQEAQRAAGRPVTPMVVDANLSSLPPHELVTALLEQSSTRPPSPLPSPTPRPPTPAPVTVPASTVARAAAASSESDRTQPNEAQSDEGQSTEGQAGEAASSEVGPDETGQVHVARVGGGSGSGGGGSGSGSGGGGSGGAPRSGEGFFDAGPLLADLVTGPEHGRSNGRPSRRVLVAATIGALVALGSGAVAVALARGGDDGKPRAAVVTAPSTTVAPETSPPTEAPTTEAPTPTTATTTPPTTQATVAPATTPTTAATPRPSVLVTGPLTIEDNVRYVWHSTATDATSGHWSLSGGPPINLSGTTWSPGTDFGMRAGCFAVGSTYHLTLTVQGPGGANSATISYNVIDRNGTCR